MGIIIQPRRAVRYKAKGRVALTGTSGGGKSLTALRLAHSLADGGKVFAVDTEHGSLSKYAPKPGERADNQWIFDFEVDEPAGFSIDYWLASLTYAEQNGYAVHLTDSLSHFWMGKDGALEYVDKAKRGARDGMEGWKQFRPHEREMVDRMIASPCHIIVTMRVKTDYEEQIVDGKKKRVKIGLAPVQREGLEYEFDLCGDLDNENFISVDKTRCRIYREQKYAVQQYPDAAYFQPFVEWLAGGADRENGTSAQAAKPTPAPTAATRQSNGTTTIHPKESASAPAQAGAVNGSNPSPQRHTPTTNTVNGGVKSPSASTTDGGTDANPAGRGTTVKSPTPPAAAQAAPPIPQAVVDMWTAMGRSKTEFFEVFSDLKTSFVELVGDHGEANYHVILQRHGVEHSNQFKSLSKARSCAKEMWESIQLLASAPPANPDITDDDVPFGGPSTLFDAAPEPPSPYNQQEVA